MKLFKLILFICLGLALMAGFSAAGDKTAPELERLKQLVGSWKAVDPEGKAVAITYKLASSDNSLMETLDTEGKKQSMVTMYHLDNDKVMMTHYCSLGNQPRMRVDKSNKDPNKLSFKFVDGTNLKSKDDMHMHRLVFTFKDKDHFTQEWFLRDKGKESPVVFNFERAN